MRKLNFKAVFILICSLLLPLQVMAAEPVNNAEADISENGYYAQLNSGGGSMQPQYQYQVVTNGGPLNVRDYPSTTEGNVIGTLPNGTIVEIPFLQPGWIPDGWSYMTSPMEGYISNQYIR